MKRLLGRVQASFPGRLAAAYGESKAGNYAAALAFNAFTSMFPLILGILAIAGFLIHDPALDASLRDRIVQAFPHDAHEQLTKALGGVKQHSGLLGVISVLGLLWGGSNLFSSMEFALGQIFGTNQRDLVRQKIMAVAMMAVFVVALVASVVATAGASILTGAANSLAGGPVAALATYVTGVLAAGLIMSALLIIIYRVVPNRTFRLTEVWPGAVLAATCIALLNLVWSFYARVSNGWNTYGAQFALFFILATWLFFLCQLILLGAVFNRMRQGAPDAQGLVSAPDSQARSVPAPVEAIKDRQRGRQGGGEAGAAPRVSPGRRGLRGLVQGGAVFGLIVLGPVIRLMRPPAGPRRLA